MPPSFLDLELEPWTSGEQAASSAPRTFQQEEAGRSLQRTPSKRKHPTLESSPLEQSSSKRPKNLSDIELAIIKVAADILKVPVDNLLTVHSDSQARSEHSSTTYDSLGTPSTGPEQVDGYDLPVELIGQPQRRLHAAPTSAPTFQSQAGVFDGNTNAAYQEPHTFRGDLNIDSKNHLEWWAFHSGLEFDAFVPSNTTAKQTGPPIRQEPHTQLNDWGNTRFDEATFISEPSTSGQPSWGSTPQGPHNGYYEPPPPHNIPTEPLQYPGPLGQHAPQPHRLVFGPSNYNGRLHHESRAADISPAITDHDDNGDVLGTTVPRQETRPLKQTQAYIVKRPRQPHGAKNSGDSRRPGRRGPLSEEQRLETSLTRKKGACIRCRWQAIKCQRDPLNPDGCCITCRDVSGLTMTNLPCLRYKICDAQLVDKDSHPKFIWSKRWKSMKIVEIEEWRSSEIKTVTLTQDVEGTTYDLQVREFIPVDGDSLARGWRTNGQEMKHACTNYAIANMAQTGVQMAAFAERNIGNFIRFYIKKNDTLMWNTYYMAYKYSYTVGRKEERDLLRNALKLWVGSRMESRRERISGTEVLNMEPQNWDFEADNFGAYLIPPVLQAQIELLTTACVLLPMRQEVLKGLQKLMKANLTKSWFTIYLCMFILMHSCALLTQAERLRAKREPHSPDHHPQARYYNMRLVEELHTGANVLLAHFHYCNKGSHPFAMDWRSTNNSSISFAELDPEQMLYMQEATDEVERRANKFKLVKEKKMFEDDYYFLSQLYEYDWVPTHTI